jgi:urease accessory protein
VAPEALLHLLHLADSALPIGSLSHSFGLEALVFDGDIEAGAQSCPASVGAYLEDCLSETLLVDAVFCREAHSRAVQGDPVDDLNRHLSARRPARETREASLTMGRRFAALAGMLQPSPALLDLAKADELHHAVAFGFTCGLLEIDADAAVGAFLHQSILTIISAAQRLLPLGQRQASRIAWELKVAILETVKQTRTLSFRTAGSFAHLPETASMRHPCLPTRLFVS